MRHQHSSEMVTLVPLTDHCTSFSKLFYTLTLWLGGQPLCSQFRGLPRGVLEKNLSILAILGSSSLSSWNLSCHHILIDLEIEDLERYVSSLNCMHLSSTIPNARAWSLSFSSLFLVKSLFVALSNLSNLCPFSLAKFVW